MKTFAQIHACFTAPAAQCIFAYMKERERTQKLYFTRIVVQVQSKPVIVVWVQSKPVLTSPC